MKLEEPFANWECYRGRNPPPKLRGRRYYPLTTQGYEQRIAEWMQRLRERTDQ